MMGRWCGTGPSDGGDEVAIDNGAVDRARALPVAARDLDVGLERSVGRTLLVLQQAGRHQDCAGPP